ATAVEEVVQRLSGIDMVAAVVAGGATRSASVRAGLAVVPGDASIVLVHDGARPLASRGLFAAVVAAVRNGADAVVPGVPVSDSLRRVEGAVDRTGMFAVQTPQGFPAATLRAAHAGGGDASDDATLVESNGGRVVVVEGEADNLKITRPVDLLVARELLGSSDG
ncbi:MAG: 2-C-methyl-D-erythritol 4-phosphate cytidylyltransferase, partial [Acidimicrobiales bacterium]|nr:2-C-methyl-D-erythritol 4-phosphate cytidylyltransferase [Acidimicrobiales bacterium]